MPLLCGDNPLSNVAPSKFLRLTDTMLFILHQWAEGRFINEEREGDRSRGPHAAPAKGAALDRGALASALGGAFCPGGEASWIMRNPAIYSAPYRIHATPPQQGALSQPARHAGRRARDRAPNLAKGLEPGDITKYDAVPWQADFNECTNQPIDITYAAWNSIQPGEHRRSGEVDRAADLLVAGASSVLRSSDIGPWSPTPQNNAGDLQMVTEWTLLGFVTQDAATIRTQSDRRASRTAPELIGGSRWRRPPTSAAWSASGPIAA